MTTANNIPIAAAFTPAKKVDEETAMRVTRDALAVESSRWMIGDSEFNMLEWHDHLLAGGRADCSVQPTEHERSARY
ncbi:ISH11-type transposase ISHwa14 [Haloarcula marismortui ATCC 33799]|uniref:ISH11-type transposase ISHwa14 n=1 Tax=Haloarcula marismortui ATCC 33799 TaxID=662475 RepID=M0L1L5_9EURY|nr:ISH11-type transposase ISHwa14 [Haloarcula californiae ATCC 33799]